MPPNLALKAAELCSSLIRIQSYSGQEGTLVRKLAGVLRRLRHRRATLLPRVAAA